MSGRLVACVASPMVLLLVLVALFVGWASHDSANRLPVVEGRILYPTNGVNAVDGATCVRLPGEVFRLAEVGR